MSDFILSHHGTINLLLPVTEAAQDWCDEFLPEDASMFGRSYAVEPRYTGPIVEGIDADGLTLGA